MRTAIKKTEAMIYIADDGKEFHEAGACMAWEVAIAREKVGNAVLRRRVDDDVWYLITNEAEVDWLWGVTRAGAINCYLNDRYVRSLDQFSVLIGKWCKYQYTYNKYSVDTCEVRYLEYEVERLESLLYRFNRLLTGDDLEPLFDRLNELLTGDDDEKQEN